MGLETVQKVSTFQNLCDLSLLLSLSLCRGEAAAMFKHHGGAITSVEWHPDDSTVFASAGEDDQVSKNCKLRQLQFMSLLVLFDYLTYSLALCQSHLSLCPSFSLCLSLSLSFSLSLCPSPSLTFLSLSYRSYSGTWQLKRTPLLTPRRLRAFLHSCSSSTKDKRR